MRHFPSPGPITPLAVGVVHAARAAALIPRPGRATRRPPRRLGAARAAVTLAAVAVATDHHLPATTGAVEQAGGRAHRQLPPMRPGSPPTGGRYLPTARATHAPGCGTGEDCGGRDQCRTCLNGTDPADHRVVLVICLIGDTRQHALAVGRGPVLRLSQARGPRRLGPRLRYAPPGTDPAPSRNHGTIHSPVSPRSQPLRPPATDRSSPPSLAIARAIRQLSAGFGSHRHGTSFVLLHALKTAAQPFGFAQLLEESSLVGQEAQLIHVTLFACGLRRSAPLS